jgi:hypothetical protein
MSVIEEIISKHNLTAQDLRDMVKALPLEAGCFNIWDLFDIYGIQLDRAMENARQLAIGSTE